MGNLIKFECELQCEVSVPGLYAVIILVRGVLLVLSVTWPVYDLTKSAIARDEVSRFSASFCPCRDSLRRLCTVSVLI